MGAGLSRNCSASLAIFEDPTTTKVEGEGAEPLPSDEGMTRPEGVPFGEGGEVVIDSASSVGAESTGRSKTPSPAPPASPSSSEPEQSDESDYEDDEKVVPVTDIIAMRSRLTHQRKATLAQEEMEAKQREDELKEEAEKLVREKQQEQKQELNQLNVAGNYSDMIRAMYLTENNAGEDEEEEVRRIQQELLSQDNLLKAGEEDDAATAAKAMEAAMQGDNVHDADWTSGIDLLGALDEQFSKDPPPQEFAVLETDLQPGLVDHAGDAFLPEPQDLQDEPEPEPEPESEPEPEPEPESKPEKKKNKKVGGLSFAEEPFIKEKVQGSRHKRSKSLSKPLKKGMKKIRAAYKDFWNKVSFRKGWSTPPFEYEPVRDLLKEAATISVKLRAKLDKESKGMKLRLVGGQSGAYFAGFSELPSDRKAFVRNLVHETMKDGSGYVEELTYDKVDRFFEKEFDPFCLHSHVRSSTGGSELGDGEYLQEEIEENLALEED